MASLPDGELLIVWDESVVDNDKAVKKIGVQKAIAEGKRESQEYIAPDDRNASYPVIVPVSDKSSIIAYSSRRGQTSYMSYHVVSVIRSTRKDMVSMIRLQIRSFACTAAASR